MGFLNNIKSAFYNETEESTVAEFTNTGIDDSTYKFCSTLTALWQKDYALSVVANILTAFLINVEWKTYGTKGVVKGNEWLRFNYSPNKRETAPEFYKKLAEKLIYERKALVIETASGEFFVADGYAFKNGEELLMKDNTFINVRIGNITLNRTFRENRDCMFIKAPQNEMVDLIFKSMAQDYMSLKELISEGADKALGMKLSLNLGAQAKNKYDAKFIKQLQEVYKPLMNSRNAVFVTYKGEELSDLTERQRGSEVQQVLEAVDNNIKVNHEILCNVGSAYGIPQKFMTGDYTADNADIYTMAITMFGKPYLVLLSKKFTLYALNEEDIIKGAKIEANLDSIKFVESLKLATAVDKLIGSGAYTINEVREKIGDDPVEEGYVRFITKNYAVLSEYAKGGGDDAT